MKDLYILIHEELVEQYMEWNPNATDEEAYEMTAANAWDELQNRLADQADNARKQAREKQHGV